MRNEVGRQPRFPDPLEDLTSAAENWEGRWAELHLSWTSPLGKAESGGTEDLWKCILVLSRVANTVLECVPLDVNCLAAGAFVLIHRLS